MADDYMDETDNIKALIVIDGANVAHEYSQRIHRTAAPTPDVEGIHAVMRQWHDFGHDTVCILPRSYEHRDGFGNLMPIVPSGAILWSPPDDDLFCITVARQHDAFIVSNDQFRAEIERTTSMLGKVEGDRLRSFLQDRRISYHFTPRGDVVHHPLTSSVARLASRAAKAPIFAQSAVPSTGRDNHQHTSTSDGSGHVAAGSRQLHVHGHSRGSLGHGHGHHAVHAEAQSSHIHAPPATCIAELPPFLAEIALSYPPASAKRAAVLRHGPEICRVIGAALSGDLSQPPLSTSGYTSVASSSVHIPITSPEHLAQVLSRLVATACDVHSKYTKLTGHGRGGSGAVYAGHEVDPSLQVQLWDDERLGVLRNGVDRLTKGGPPLLQSSSRALGADQDAMR